MQPIVTIKQIEDKEFKYKSRGYDPDEVDTFLDSVCDEMERLQEQAKKMNDMLEAQRAEIDRLSNGPAPKEQPVATNQEDVKSMGEVLTAAVRFKQQIEQEASNKAAQLLSDAQQKAEQLLTNAENEANHRLETLNEEHDRLSKQVNGLREACTEYRRKFLALLEEQREIMEQEKDLF